MEQASMHELTGQRPKTSTKRGRAITSNCEHDTAEQRPGSPSSLGWAGKHVKFIEQGPGALTLDAGGHKAQVSRGTQKQSSTQQHKVPEGKISLSTPSTEKGTS